MDPIRIFFWNLKWMGEPAKMNQWVYFFAHIRYSDAEAFKALPPPPPGAIIEADSFKTADPLFTSLVELGVGKDALSSTFPNSAKPAEPIGTT